MDKEQNRMNHIINSFGHQNVVMNLPSCSSVDVLQPDHHLPEQASQNHHRKKIGAQKISEVSDNIHEISVISVNKFNFVKR